MTAKQLTAPTTIRIEHELKVWLLKKTHTENRSLGNVINTLLKREKDREDGLFVSPINISLEELRKFLKQ